ncbi:MAG: hypothetical protein CMN93_08230 [Synechococcus sp. CPC35]|nr:hypothetical protein [Synechococcus sp. CPC35]
MTVSSSDQKRRAACIDAREQVRFPSVSLVFHLDETDGHVRVQQAAREPHWTQRISLIRFPLISTLPESLHGSGEVLVK